MREIFTIVPSRRQRGGLFAVYLLAAVAAAAYVGPGEMAVLAALLLSLLGWRESRRLEPAEALLLEIRADRAAIGPEQGGQPHFYAKYKVYACRWFAILRLIDGHHSRTLILNSDCFRADNDYRLLRHRLGISRDAN